MRPDEDVAEIERVLDRFVDVRAGTPQDVIDALEEAGYRIVTIDQALHGDRSTYRLT
jgi:ppGpp synthetase/RelA/SpoT-type nucleotidyltranferase